MTEIVLYSKPGCCLCDEMKARLDALRTNHAFQLREVNILENASAFEQFSEQIPVIFIDGHKAFKYHLDEKKFLQRLNAESTTGENINDEG